MGMPPKNPMGNDKSYFTVMCEEASGYLKIPINFDGYEEVVEKYSNSKLLNKDDNWEIAKELNAWSEYCASIAHYIQNEFLNAETEKLHAHSQASISYSEKNVSAGERFANTMPDVIRSRFRRNALKSLYDTLIARKDFLDKAFYQCKSAISNIQIKGDANG